MKLHLPVVLASLAALWLPSAADAASPGPASRQQLLGLGVCESGPLEGQRCVDDFDCDDAQGAPDTCSTPVGEVAVRGVLTLISDKDSGRFEDESTIPLTTDFAGNVVPTDFSKTTLTLVLEFTFEGRDYAFAETFQDLGDFFDASLNIDCRGFCVPTWREPAVESRIAIDDSGGGSGAGGGGGGGGGTGTGGGGGGQAGGAGIRIQWATPPPAMGRALSDALGLPDGAVPFLEKVSTTAIFDHAAETDPLATVRREKVLIRVLLPASP